MNLRNFFVGRAIGFVVLLVIVGIVAAFYGFNNYIYEKKQATATDDYKNAEYLIEGTRVKLKDGVSEVEAAPGSASKVVTRYFGNEIISDINDDGREDAVFILTQQPGGSGTMYYVVAALNTERGYVGSEGYLLGDRIAPQTTERGSGQVVIVNYADRAPGEPFTTSPSVGKTVWLRLDPVSMQFGIVEQNFEGEADPARMSLGMKTWTWVSSLYGDGRELKPLSGKTFTLKFNSDGSFGGGTDCNSYGGSYTVNGSQISFGQIAMTEMYCEGSKDTDFVRDIQNTSSYHFTSKGELILDIKFDSGSIIFK